MRKMEYEETNVLQRQGKIRCGYLRNPMIEDGKVYGKCSLYDDECINHVLPNHECPRIAKFFKRRRTERDDRA